MTQRTENELKKIRLKAFDNLNDANKVADYVVKIWNDNNLSRPEIEAIAVSLLLHN